MKVLVTGANGVVGSAICRALLDSAGMEPLALHRDGADLSLLPPGAESAPGDFTSREEMAALMEEHRPGALIHAAAVVSTGVPDLEESLRVNVEGTRALLEAAGAGGVTKWIQISSMSAHSGNKSVYGGTKFLAEEEVRRQPMEWVILRPSLVYAEVRRGIFHRLARLVASLPVVPLVGGGREPIRPIHRDDLAAVALEALRSPAAAGGVYPIGGPEEWDLRAMVLAMRRQLGRRPVTVPLPLPLCRLGSILGEMLFEDPPLTSDNLEGMTRALPCDITAAARDLAFTPRPFAEGFAQCLERGLLER